MAKIRLDLRSIGSTLPFAFHVEQQWVIEQKPLQKLLNGWLRNRLICLNYLKKLLALSDIETGARTKSGKRL